ncbi:MAG: hypothetical protein EG823_06880 [Actinobacteria bacterium]|nr:hypothetical protein [Actinomycetota bacterium]
MRLTLRLEGPRRVVFAVGATALFAGAAIAILAPAAKVAVPTVSPVGEAAPSLSYVRSLPDAGDAPLIRPVGLAVGDGRIYVSDSEAAVVRVFSVAGFDLGEIGRGALVVPAYAASDNATGTLLVVDRETRSVLRFSAEGVRLDDLRPSNESTPTWGPLGVACDGEGSVAVTDSSGRHRMVVMNRAGEVRFSLGSAEATAVPGDVSVALDFPNAVAFGDDTIWVSDGNNRRVLVFDREGAFQRLVRVNGIARGLAFLEGDQGKTYVAVVDALASEIVLLDTDGSEVTRYGAPGSAAGQLAYPNDVVYDAQSSQLFVADTGNARVQVWSVQWPAESFGVRAVAEKLRLSPMRLSGLMLMAASLAAVAGAFWPRRRLGAEAAIVEDTPPSSTNT